MNKETEDQLINIAMRLDSVEQQLNLLCQIEDYEKINLNTYLYAVIDSIRQSSREVYQYIELMYHGSNSIK